ncbi:MAG TPA: TRAP transporter small permease [Alphaproteobacteria bacterium]
MLACLERWLVAANRAVLVAMMAAMVACVFANVLARYGFGFSIIWAEEISQYLMVWLTYLGAGLAMREGRHVAVELAQDLLPERARRCVRWIVAVGIFAFVVALTILGFQFAAFAWIQETPVLNIPLGIPYLAIPCGALVFALHFVLVMRDYVAREFEHPESLEPEDAATIEAQASIRQV